MRSFLLITSFVVVAGAGCGGSTLADCEALASEQADCMTEEAVADCNATNTQCEENGGEVLVLESCPLQFACSEAP